MTSTDLELLTRAEQALALADNVPELTDIVDVAEAARVLAQRAHLGQQAENRAALIKLRAQRKAGELLAQMRADGQRHAGDRSGDKGVPQLSDLGVSKKQSSRWQQLAEYYTDDDLQILAAKATDEQESLSYKDLIRKIRARNTPAERQAPAPAAPAPSPGIVTLIEDVARSVFQLDPAAVRVELTAQPEAERNIANRLLVDAERWLHDLVSDYDRRRIHIWDEMADGGSTSRLAELQAELDALFVQEHNLQPGDVVDHDGQAHTIERASPPDAPEEEAHAAPASTDDAQPSDDVNGSIPLSPAEGAAASEPNNDRVLCAYPACVLDDEHDGDHQLALTDYVKPPKDCSNAEAWARQQIGTALDEQPNSQTLADLQQELYAGVDDDRALEIRNRLHDLMQLDDYQHPTSSPIERQCRDLIAALPTDDDHVADLQQQLYRGVTMSTAASIRRELKDLKSKLGTAAAK